MSTAQPYVLGGLILGVGACSSYTLGGTLGFTPNAAGEFTATDPSAVEIGLHGGAANVEGPTCSASALTQGGNNPPIGIPTTFVTSAASLVFTIDGQGAVFPGTFSVVSSNATVTGNEAYANYGEADSGVSASAIGGTVTFELPNPGELRGSMAITLVFPDGGSAGTLSGSFDVPLCTNAL
jgi:hypothetical protein